MRSLLAAVCLVPALAFASLNGIAGFSGRDGASCSTCHVPTGTAPTVTLTGPASLAAGATGSYTLKIAGGPGSVAGFSAALGGANSGGAVLTPGSGEKMSGGELVHDLPQSFSGGSASFSFTVKAPLTSGTFTIFASGVSANNSSTNKDDNSASTTLAITVGSGSMGTPDAGSTPVVPDAGTVTTAPKPDAGTAGTGGSGSLTPSKTTHKQVAEVDSHSGVADGEFGCSSTSTGPMALFAAAVLMVLNRRRVAQAKN